jgi:hypothetical protein
VPGPGPTRDSTEREQLKHKASTSRNFNQTLCTRVQKPTFTMAPKRVLKFSQTDNESSFVLVQVSPKGSKPLDLKLVATEGEAPYVCSCEFVPARPGPQFTLISPVRHDRTASLCVKNCPVSEDEWQAILQSIFEQAPQPDIQASATVQSASSMSLTIRKKVQGITVGCSPRLSIPSRILMVLFAATSRHHHA